MHNHRNAIVRPFASLFLLAQMFGAVAPAFAVAPARAAELSAFESPRVLAPQTTLVVTSTNDSGAGSLRAAMATSVNGDTIQFSLPANSVITLGGTELVEHHSVTIDGSTATNLVIDANNASRAINALSTITITSLTIQNGNGSGLSGGGINAQISLILTNVNVLSSTSTIQGGGVKVAINASISGGEFRNNRSTGSAFAGGGGLYVEGALVMSGTQFISNTAYARGGGLFANAGGNLTNVSFISNAVTNASFSGDGGGGALFSVSGPAFITGGVFRANVSNDSAAGLLTKAALTMTGTQFLSNTASDSGGGVFIQDAAVITNALFQNNSVGTSGGGVLANAPIEIFDSRFVSNTARNGGGIHALLAVTLTNSSFISNGALNGNGGGVYLTSGGVVIGGNFQANRATIGLGSGVGGGAGVYGEASVWIASAQFISNTADSWGGGVFANQMLNVYDSLFQFNRSLGERGGGAYANGIATIERTRFIANEATSGSGLYHANSTVQLQNNLFARNKATTLQGASLHLSSTSIAYVWHSTFASPTLASGAAIRAASGPVNIVNSLIASHTVGINRDGFAAVTQSDNFFVGNTANLSGTIVSAGQNSTGNPGFISQATDNYHLGPTSAAINTSPNVGVFVDIDLDPRAIGCVDAGYDETLKIASLCKPIATNSSPTLAGNPTFFTATVTGTLPIALTWNFGDGTPTAMGSTTSHTYAAQGTYTAVVTATNAAGSRSATTLVVICNTVVTSANDSGPGSLRSAVVCANVGSTITFDPLLAGKTITLTTGEVGIGKRLTINGSGAPGVRVSANGASRVFSFTAPIAVAALTIQRGNAAGNGGGILSNNALTLTNVSVMSSTATGNGGGIFVSGDLSMTNVTIANNSSVNHGGGVFGNGATNVLSGVVLMNNSCTDAGCSGGGLNLPAGGRLMNTQVLSNTANDSAGGVRVNIATTVMNSTFRNNVCTGTVCDGGGLYQSHSAPLMITSSQFISNTAGGNGGGVNSDGPTTIEGGLFQHNKTVSAFYAGGIYAASSLIVSGTRFFSNTTPGVGGGAYAGGSASIVGAWFEGNVGSIRGGGFDSLNYFEISGTQFINNQSNGFGGGAFGSNVNIVTNSLFRGNASGSFGGGIRGGALTLNNTVLMSNTAASAGGGALAGGIATTSGGLFQGNRALGSSGGGLQSGNTTIVSGTHFIGNTAYAQGGNMFVGNNSAHITNARFERGLGTTGGGLYVNNGALNMTDTLVLNNIATDTVGAGGAHVVGAATIYGGLFENNRTNGLGGGLYASAGLAVTRTQFISNTAALNGGGLYQSLGDGRIVNALFARNSSPGAGGAILFSAPTNAIVLHTTVVGPSNGLGSGIAMAVGAVGITDTIITSYTYGILNTASTVTEDYNLFHNVAFNTGGPGSTTSGGNSIVGDPAFANQAADNYHLTGGSAARNTGANAGVFTDFDGDPRPIGAGFDIGFDEWRGRVFLPSTSRGASSGW